jgi:hypothetical protein
VSISYHFDDYIALDEGEELFKLAAKTKINGLD